MRPPREKKGPGGSLDLPQPRYPRSDHKQGMVPINKLRRIVLVLFPAVCLARTMTRAFSFPGRRSFLLIWAGQMVSLIGSGLTSFALGV